jgi:phenylacetate-CoA ligase
MLSQAKRLLIEHVKRGSSVPFRAAASQAYDLHPHEISAHQLELLKRQYQHATTHVPYYAESAVYAPGLLDQATDLTAALKSLPVLGKEAVKSRPDQFVSRHRAPYWTHTTGGTTGSPLQVAAGLFERGWTEAILAERYHRLIGTRTPRTLRLSGFLDSTTSGELWRRVWGSGVTYLSIYQLTETRKDQIVDLLRRLRPQLVHGYASALVQLATVVSADDVPELANALFVSTSETLYEEQRSYVERRLQLRVLNEYGSQEGQHLVLECLERSMHVHPTRGVVELLDQSADVPAAAGTYGRVVVTGLLARRMPLIRYDLGDSALVPPANSACPCGLAWPVIGPVSGRTEDLVRLRDGRRVGLLAHSTLKDLSGIREAQIVQTSYETFTYRVALEPGADVPTIERSVVSSLRGRLGIEAHVTFEYVESLPRTHAGKLRAVVVAFDGH